NYFPICHLGNQVFANVNLLQRMLCLSYIYLLTSLKQMESMAQTTCRALQYKGKAFAQRRALLNYNGLARRQHSHLYSLPLIVLPRNSIHQSHGSSLFPSILGVLQPLHTSAYLHLENEYKTNL